MAALGIRGSIVRLATGVARREGPTTLIPIARRREPMILGRITPSID
jgi:hypothetical protein